MLSGYINRIKSSDTFKNVAKISIGTLTGQLISFITLPIFAWMYGAEIIGLFTFFNSMALFVNSFSDLGLTFSLMTQKEEEMAEKSYQVISTITLGIGIVFSVLLMFYYTFIKINDSGLNMVFIFVFIIFSVYTLQQIQLCYTWLNRNSKYEILMKNPIINNAIFGITGIMLGIIGFKQYGYFVGWLLGQLVTLIHMKRYLPRKMFTFKANDFKLVMVANKNFITLQLPTNIINVAKNQFPIFIIKAFFGTTVLGYYSISIKLLNIPITLLGTAVGRVFFQKSSEMTRNNQPIGEFTFRSLKKMMKIAIFPIVGLLVVGDYAVTLFLGSEWTIAGNIVVILTVQTYFMFLTTSIQGISINLNKQKYLMITYILQIIETFIALIIGKFIFDSIYIGLLIMSALFILINIGYFCAMFKVMKISIWEYIKNIIIHIFIIAMASILLRTIFHIIIH